MIEEIVREYFDAVNNEQWDHLARLWTEDAELDGVGGRSRHGPVDIVDGYKRFHSFWKEHYDEPQRILVCGNTATVEVRFTGINGAGEPVEFSAVDIIDIHDGLISKLSNWYDLDVVRHNMRMSSS